MKRNFEHPKTIFNENDANIIVPEVVKLVNPKSVVDVGCGIGTWLNVFKKYGVKNVLGIDGEWTEKDLVYENLATEEYLQVNLELPIHLNKKFDLVCCLEVAEHINSTASDIFINTLTSLGNVILFSAAIPGQGGYEHINEQWPSYWQAKFEKKGFKILDVLRYKFWNNKDVFLWYKQNILLVIHESELEHFNYKYQSPLDIVHPDMYFRKLGIKHSFLMLMDACGRKIKRIHL